MLVALDREREREREREKNKREKEREREREKEREILELHKRSAWVRISVQGARFWSQARGFAG